MMRKALTPVSLDVKAVGDDGSFVGYASRFGERDTGGDTVMPGAFARSLKSRDLRDVKMFREHDAADPIGVWTSMIEDDIGLRCRGELILEVGRARETHALMKRGALDGLSIGYRAVKAEIDDQGGRRLVDVDLVEVSIVALPMLTSARIEAVKAADIRTKREFERALRDAGFSRATAGYFAAGWTPPARRDAGASSVEALSDLARRIATLTE